MKEIKEFFEGFKEGQKLFGESLSTLVNSFLLILVYIFGVGLTSIFLKISNKNLLEINLHKEKKSYWEELNLYKKPIKEYYRQF